MGKLPSRDKMRPIASIAPKVQRKTQNIVAAWHATIMKTVDLASQAPASKVKLGSLKRVKIAMMRCTADGHLSIAVPFEFSASKPFIATTHRYAMEFKPILLCLPLRRNHSACADETAIARTAEPVNLPSRDSAEGSHLISNQVAHDSATLAKSRQSMQYGITVPVRRSECSKGFAIAASISRETHVAANLGLTGSAGFCI